MEPNMMSKSNPFEAKKTCSTRWKDAIYTIQAPIIATLLTVSGISARNPRHTISVVVTLSFVLVLIGLATNFRVIVDNDRLWTPQSAKSIQHMEWLENESGFPANVRKFFLYFHQNGENALGYDQVRRIFHAVDAVRDLNGYADMCSDSTNGNGVCTIHGVVDFFNESTALFEQQISTDEETIAALSQEVYPGGRPVSRNSIMGYPTADANNKLVSVESYMVLMEFPETDKAIDFEKEALDVILALNDEWQQDPSTSFRVEVQAERSADDEFYRSIVVDIPLIPLVFVIMAIFTSLAFAKRDKLQSRSLLGLAAVTSVLLSLMSGYGFLFICGVPLTSMTQILPFIIFGIGLDDVFVITGAYFRTDVTADPVDRMRITIQDCGMSITLTTLTSMLAFGLGCMSSIPAVFWLCLYASVTIFWVYVYQLTFFLACLVLDDKRIMDRRRDCCICWKVPDDEDGNDENPREEIDEEIDGLVDRVMEYYAVKLLHPKIKVTVLIGFAVLAVMSALSVTKLEQSFDFREVLPSDSYLVDFFNTLEEYSQSNSLEPFHVVFRNVDQSDPTIQEQMEQYLEDLVLQVEAIHEGPEFFWLRDFRNFIQQPGIIEMPFDIQIFFFLQDPIFQELYGGNMVLDDKGNLIESRCQINVENVDIKIVRDQIDVLADLSQVTTAQPINQGKENWSFFIYEGICNVWEFYSAGARELTLTTITGVSAVVFVTAALVPHWSAALFILPMICVLYIDLLGFLQWCGVTINPVSYVSAVMSIGLLVDFMMHILLRYYECKGSRREKTIETLRTMGSSVLMGAISTFLGTLPLAFSSSQIFTTVFIAFMGLVVLGASHGLILLPVLLSVLGPDDSKEREEETSQESS